MSITDELRRFANGSDWIGCTASVTARKMLDVADRIDAEHERLMQEQPYTIDMVAMTDEKMAEHGWVRLPKDADGEYIRIGDVLTDDAEFKSEGKVMRLMLEDEGWMVGLGCGGWTESSIHEWHHYHEPTVEDVLREFVSAYDRIGGEDEEHQKYLDLITEFAAKLQLRGDGE